MQKKKEPGRISKSILTAIRNRPGYRPLDANITGGDIVIASYNVHKCIGIDKQFNPQRTADVISEINADVIALQEADRRFGERSGLLDRSPMSLSMTARWRFTASATIRLKST